MKDHDTAPPCRADEDRPAHSAGTSPQVPDFRPMMSMNEATLGEASYSARWSQRRMLMLICVSSEPETMLATFRDDPAQIPGWCEEVVTYQEHLEAAIVLCHEALYRLSLIADALIPAGKGGVA